MRQILYTERGLTPTHHLRLQGRGLCPESDRRRGPQLPHPAPLQEPSWGRALQGVTSVPALTTCDNMALYASHLLPCAGEGKADCPIPGGKAPGSRTHGAGPAHHSPQVLPYLNVNLLKALIRGALFQQLRARALGPAGRDPESRLLMGVGSGPTESKRISWLLTYKTR